MYYVYIYMYIHSITNIYIYVTTDRYDIYGFESSKLSSYRGGSWVTGAGPSEFNVPRNTSCCHQGHGVSILFKEKLEIQRRNGSHQLALRLWAGYQPTRDHTEAQRLQLDADTDKYYWVIGRFWLSSKKRDKIWRLEILRTVPLMSFLSIFP